jgi:hypothetical protein
MSLPLFDWADENGAPPTDSAEIINLMCNKAMTDRLLRDFWERQFFGIRHLKDATVIPFYRADAG